MALVPLTAPAEGSTTGTSGTTYRAQDASALRVDAQAQDVPGLTALGFVPFGQEPAAATAPDAPAVAESSDTAGGFLEPSA